MKVTQLKYENIQKIRECFYELKVYTKQELVDITHISRAGVTNILSYLLERHEIIYIGDSDSTGGRKRKEYQLNKTYKTLCLLTLKAHHEYMIEICDLAHQTLFKEEGIFDDMSFLKTYLSKYDVFIIVISIPGVCEEGIIKICDIEEFVGVNLIDEIESQYNITCIIENDVNVASIGLHQMYPKENIAFLYQPGDYYIGCGMIIHHELYNGSHHLAGELRYMPLYDETKQNELLQTNPKHLLETQLQILLCVMDPDLIGIVSDVCTIDKLSIHGPFSGEIKILESMDLYRDEGLFQIGKHQLLKEEQRYE